MKIDKKKSLLKLLENYSFKKKKESQTVNVNGKCCRQQYIRIKN